MHKRFFFSSRAFWELKFHFGFAITQLPRRRFAPPRSHKVNEAIAIAYPLRPKDILLEHVLQQGRSQNFRRSECEWGARKRADRATVRQGSGGAAPGNFWEILLPRVHFYNRVRFFTAVFNMLERIWGPQKVKKFPFLSFFSSAKIFSSLQELQEPFVQWWPT